MAKTIRMVATRFSLALSFGLVLSTAGLAYGSQGGDQASLRAVLADGSRSERKEAVKRIGLIPPAERDRATWFSLSAEVDRLNGEIAERRRAYELGLPLEPAGERVGDYLFEIATLLSQTEDPIVLPALLKCIDSGTKAMDAIAAFGESAASSVIALTSGDYVTRSIAIQVLTRMLERPTRHPLSVTSRTQIVAAAHQRLSDGSQPAALFSAMDLAVATGDAGLIQQVVMFSQNDAAARAVGLSNPVDIVSARRRARSALTARGIVVP